MINQLPASTSSHLANQVHQVRSDVNVKRRKLINASFANHNHIRQVVLEEDDCMVLQTKDLSFLNPVTSKKIKEFSDRQFLEHFTRSFNLMLNLHKKHMPHIGIHEIHVRMYRQLLGRGGFGRVFVLSSNNFRCVKMVWKYGPISDMQKCYKRYQKVIRVFTNNIDSKYLQTVTQTPRLFLHTQSRGKAHLLFYFEIKRVVGTSLHQLKGFPGTDCFNQKRVHTLTNSFFRVVSIARQLLKALVTFQGQNLTHNDIKPHNVMLSKTGEVTLIDFGSCKESNILFKDLPQLGTYGYYHPDAYHLKKKNHSVGNRSDLFSVGMTLFYLVTQRNFFPSVFWDKGSYRIPYTQVYDCPRENPPL